MPSLGVMSDWMKLVVLSFSSWVKIFFDYERLRCREKSTNFLVPAQREALRAPLLLGFLFGGCVGELVLLAVVVVDEEVGGVGGVGVYLGVEMAVIDFYPDLGEA